MTLPQSLLILLVGLACAAATLSGGFVALHYRTTPTLLLGFSGGAVVGVSLFDLLPEAIEIGGTDLGTLGIAAGVIVGFAIYAALDRAGSALGDTLGRHRVHLRAGSLTTHSLMDGLGIGFGFQVSASVGAVVAAAVLAHDFLDGANTVAVSLRDDGREQTARRWLAADAAAPLVGICLASYVAVPDVALAALMAAFAGVFLFIGLCDLLSRAYARGPVARTLGATALGLAFIYSAVRLAA